MNLSKIEEKAESFFEFPTDNKDHVTTTSAILFAWHCCELLENEIDRLRGHIIDCLNENGHLADGECCTLIELKRAVPDWELSE